MHDTLQFAATLVAILGGILFSRRDARRLDAKVDDLRKDMKADIHALRSEIRGEMNTLRSEVHKDIADLRNEFTRKTDTIVDLLFNYSERITKVEMGKQDKP